jgi:hypothetical protein
MCHLAREREAAQPLGSTDTPPSPGRLRPRWIGAGLALAAGMAVAAWVLPPSASGPLATKQVQGPAAAAVPVTLRATIGGGGTEQPLAMDDDVPTAVTPSTRCAHEH